jgi:hypothetical protein
MPVDRVTAWKKANSERWREIQRASRKRCYVPHPRVLQTEAERKARKVAWTKRWRERNPEKYAAQLAVHKAKPRVTPEQKARHAQHQTWRVRCMKQARPAWADTEEIERIYLVAQKLGMQVDHIIPLKGPNVCGLHIPENLQLLPASENFRKRNRVPEDDHAR